MGRVGSTGAVDTADEADWGIGNRFGCSGGTIRSTACCRRRSIRRGSCRRAALDLDATLGTTFGAATDLAGSFGAGDLVKVCRADLVSGLMTGSDTDSAAGALGGADTTTGWAKTGGAAAGNAVAINTWMGFGCTRGGGGTGTCSADQTIAPNILLSSSTASPVATSQRRPSPT